MPIAVALCTLFVDGKHDESNSSMDAVPSPAITISLPAILTIAQRCHNAVLLCSSGSF